MSRETMTPRERWQAVLAGRKPDRVPMDYWATEEATDSLKKFLGCSTREELDKKLHIDPLIGVGPEYKGPPLPADADVFGCRYQNISYSTGVYQECVYNPLSDYNSVEEIAEKYRWPIPDWYDYTRIPLNIVGKEAYPISGGHSEPFLRYQRLRGQEQALLDLVMHPEIVHYCLDKLFQMDYEHIRRIYEQVPGRVMITYVAEDMGSQESLILSPAHIREFLLPRMKRIIDLVHQAGAYAFHHNDGAIRKIVPDLIDTGIDILNPVQWRCRGMDREALKRDFGDRLIFHGGMDNQQTLPFGTPEDVRREALENLEVLGRDGGYILAPCHNIQAVSPPENIVAMYETGYRNGWS